MYVPTAARQRLLYVARNRSYISTPLIDMQDVAILELRSHRDLITGKVQVDRLVRQILGAYLSVPCSQFITNSFVIEIVLDANLDRISWHIECSLVSEYTSIPSMPACWPKPPPTCCDTSVLMLVLAIPKTEI